MNEGISKWENGEKDGREKGGVTRGKEKEKLEKRIVQGIFKSEKSLLFLWFFGGSYQVDENLWLFKILYAILLWGDLAASQ